MPLSMTAFADEELQQRLLATARRSGTCQLSQPQDAPSLGTLAAAYAPAARFGEAVKTIEEAQAVARASGADFLLPIQAERLTKFRAGNPFP